MPQPEEARPTTPSRVVAELPSPAGCAYQLRAVAFFAPPKEPQTSSQHQNIIHAEAFISRRSHHLFDAA